MSDEGQREKIWVTSREDVAIAERLARAFGISRNAVMSLALRVLDSMGHHGVTALIVRARDAAIAAAANEAVGEAEAWVRAQVDGDLKRLERRLIELEDRCQKIKRER